MNRLFTYIIVSLGLIGCQDFEPVPLSNFEEERLVVEGFITDSIQTQRLSVGLVSNLGDSSAIPLSATDISLNILEGTTVHPFYLANGTTMLSSSPFGGTPNANYEIDFCYKGNCYQKEFTMPAKPSITSFEVMPTFSGSISYYDLLLELNSPTEQYLRFEIYGNESPQIPDSLWTKISHPVYWTTEIEAGNHTYFLNQYIQNFYYLGSFAAVKILFYSLHPETAEYFKELEDFMESNSVGSQYQNPPIFYDSEVYGLMYGTTVDSAVFIF